MVGGGGIFSHNLENLKINKISGELRLFNSIDLSVINQSLPIKNKVNF